MEASGAGSDRELLLSAVRRNGLALEHATADLRADPAVVFAAMTQDVHALRYAERGLLANREFLLAAMTQNVQALSYAEGGFLDNREFLLAAIRENGRALEYAALDLRADRDVVLTAVQADGRVLRCATQELRADREVVLAAVRENGDALQYAASDLCADREVVLAAVRQNGQALRFASEGCRRDRAVVVAAACQDSLAVKFALAGLNQDHEVLQAARLSKSRPAHGQRRIVLSVRFGFHEEASDFSSLVHQRLQANAYFRDWALHNPNAFSKGFCGAQNGVMATDSGYPCRGTSETCTLAEELEGRPTVKSCWRYSFGWHLRDAQAHGGYMLQVVERQVYRMNPALVGDLELGAGQKIEEEMARSMGLPIFRLEQAGNELSKDVYGIDAEADEHLITILAAKVDQWWTSTECMADVNVADVVVVNQQLLNMCSEGDSALDRAVRSALKS